MMKTKIISLLLVSLLITACHPCKRLQRLCPPQIKDSISYVETIKYDTNYTIPDSVYWQLSLECDSNYNVLIKKISESGSGMKTEIKTVYKEDERKVKILLVSLKAQSDSILILNQEIERLKSDVKTITVEVEKPVVVYKARKIVKILAWIGVISIILVIVYIVYHFRKGLLKSPVNRLK